MPETTLSLAARQRINLGLPTGEEAVAVLARTLISPDGQIAAYIDKDGQLVNKYGVPFPVDANFSAEPFDIYSGGGVNADAGANGDGAFLHLENGLGYFDTLGVTPPTDGEAPTSFIGASDYGLCAPTKWIVVTHNGNNYGIPAYLLPSA